MTRNPWRFWKPSIKAGGAADPPMTMRRSADRSQRLGCASRSARIPSQMVGTPPANVTRSAAMRSSSTSGSSLAPGKTIFAPTSAHACGRPQALAWNMGTAGSTTSRSDNPTPSAMVNASA